MENYVSANKLKNIMKKYNVYFTKSLGQNFLIDNNILNKIAAELDSNDIGVLEVGPGAGALTQVLAQKAKKVVAVEIDSKLIPLLDDVLYQFDNVKIINKDILKLDINNLIENEFPNMPVYLVANLPYYITTPIVMNILEKKANIDKIIIMIQKEVAQRMAASPGNKDYGALSIAVQYYTKPKLITMVSPHCFMPQPKVDSVIIKLERLQSPSVEVEDERLFFAIVRAAFNQRRKTLINSLSNAESLSFEKERIKEEILNLGMDENIRGEKLFIQDFAKLSNKLKGK